MRWVQVPIMQALMVLTSVTGSLLSVPRPVAAQAGDEVWTQPRVVVDVRGPRSPIRRRLSRALRRALADEIGGLYSSRIFRQTQRKLRIPPARRTLPSQLARVARHVGAEYVVFVRVGGTPRRPERNAWGYLLSAKDGAILHKGAVPVSTVEDAKRAAGDIADAIIATLRAASAPPEPLAGAPQTPPSNETSPASALISDDDRLPSMAPTGTVTRGGPAGGDAPERPSAPAPPEPEPAPPASPSTTDRPGADTEAPDDPSRGDDASTTDRPSPSPTATGAPEPPERRGPQAPDDHAAAGWSPLPERVTAPGAPSRSPPSTAGGSAAVRVGVSVGSGLYRNYDVSSSAGDTGLSYDLAPPVISGALTLEWDLPAVPLAVRAEGAMRRLAFDIAAVDPTGFLIDTRGVLELRVLLTDALELRPQVGLRATIVSVDEVDNAVVVSSTAIAPIGGVRAIWDLTEPLQVILGLEAGYVVSYDERPARTGNSPGGLALGLDLSLRWWLSNTWALTAEGRATLDRIDFSGVPTRTAAGSATDPVRDASLSILDTALRLGVVVSL